MIDCDQYGKVRYTTGGEWKLYREQPAFDFLHDYLDPNRLIGFSAQVQDFARAIIDDREPAVTGWDGRQAVEMANAADQSAANGRVGPTADGAIAAAPSARACVSGSLSPTALRGRRRGVRRPRAPRRVLARGADRRGASWSCTYVTRSGAGHRGLHGGAGAVRRTAARPGSRTARSGRTSSGEASMSMALSRARPTATCSCTAPPTPSGDPDRELVGRRAPGAQAERPRLGAVARRRPHVDAPDGDPDADPRLGGGARAADGDEPRPLDRAAMRRTTRSTRRSSSTATRSSPSSRTTRGGRGATRRCSGSRTRTPGAPRRGSSSCRTGGSWARAGR